MADMCVVHKAIGNKAGKAVASLDVREQDAVSQRPLRRGTNAMRTPKENDQNTQPPAPLPHCGLASTGGREEK